MVALNATLILGEILAVSSATDMNPFVGTITVLKEQLFPPISKAFDYQLYALSAIFACHLCAFVFGTLAHVLKSKKYNFFHLQHTSRGTYIVPNFGFAWQVGICIWLIFLQPYIYITIRHTRGEDVLGYLAWRHLVWLPAWDAAILATWALCVVDALPRVHDRRIITSPTFLNATFILILAAAQISIIWAGTSMSRSCDSMSLAYKQLFSALLPLALRYSSMTASETRQALLNQIPLAQDAFNQTEDLILPWSIAWFFWSGWTLTLNLVRSDPSEDATRFRKLIENFVQTLHFATFRHFKNLKKELQSGTKEYGTGSFQKTREKAVYASLRNTHIVLGVNVFTGIFFVGTTLFLGARPRVAISTPLALQLETLITLYGLAVSGSVGAFASIMRAVQMPHSVTSWRSKSSTGTWDRRSPGLKVTFGEAGERKNETESPVKEEVFELQLSIQPSVEDGEKNSDERKVAVPRN